MPILTPSLEQHLRRLSAPLAEAVTASAFPSPGRIQTDNSGTSADLLARLIGDDATVLTNTQLSALFLLAGDIDRSHDISQDLSTAEGSLLHGVMHRREGDFSNAKYWMGRVGHPAWLPRMNAQIEGYRGPVDLIDQTSKVFSGSPPDDDNAVVDPTVVTALAWSELHWILHHVFGAPVSDVLVGEVPADFIGNRRPPN